MSRPIVVIPACTKLIGGYVFDAVGRKYSAAVAEVAECQPLLMPLGPGMADIGAVLEIADGILLSGSLSNVEPVHYGDEPPIDPETIDRDRDALTLPLIRTAVERKTADVRDLPRLPGTQRGSRRHPSPGGSRRRRPQRSPHRGRSYRREVRPGPHGLASRRIARLGRRGQDHREFAALAGHRSPRRRADAEAFAEDGLVEAVRGPDDDPFCLGVQWHPEWRAQSNPISSRCSAASARPQEASRHHDRAAHSRRSEAFLDANPDVQWIDAIVFDINGIPRGKRFRRSDLIGVAKSGVMMPTSVFIMDPRGNCVEETGRLWETGDPDHQFHILAGTLVPMPVGAGRHAQAVMVIEPRMSSIRAAC